IPGVVGPFPMPALCNLGLHLGEFWYLEALARDCAADGVWECLLAGQALPIAGGCGSPGNPTTARGRQRLAGEPDRDEVTAPQYGASSGCVRNPRSALRSDSTVQPPAVLAF